MKGVKRKDAANLRTNSAVFKVRTENGGINKIQSFQTSHVGVPWHSFACPLADDILRVLAFLLRLSDYGLFSVAQRFWASHDIFVT